MAVSGADGDDSHCRAPREYANKVASRLKEIGVRVDVDGRNEKMNAKIANMRCRKCRLLVVGDKAAEAGKVNVRTRVRENQDMGSLRIRGKGQKVVTEKSATL